jgi:hypothetical protein
VLIELWPGTWHSVWMVAYFATRVAIEIAGMLDHPWPLTNKVLMFATALAFSVRTIVGCRSVTQ